MLWINKCQRRGFIQLTCKFLSLSHSLGVFALEILHVNIDNTHNKMDRERERGGDL